MNILVVEDQRRLADALIAILSDSGYQVDAVYDGQSGLDYALLGDYDVMVWSHVAQYQRLRSYSATTQGKESATGINADGA